MIDLSWLTDWLQSILCAIENIGFVLLDLVVDGVNAFIVALAALIGTALSAMPGMPDLPAVPDQVTEVAGWVAWVFPVGTLIDILAFSVTAWVAWQAVVLLLRWAKATSE